MPVIRDTLGICPQYGTVIRPGETYIEKAYTDGLDGVYAECPAWEEIVTPIGP